MRPSSTCDAPSKSIRTTQEFHYTLGRAKGEQGKLDEAIAHYSRAIEINPEFSEAFISLGLALTAQGKFDAAIIRYRRAIEIEPNDATAHYKPWIKLCHTGQVR